MSWHYYNLRAFQVFFWDMVNYLCSTYGCDDGQTEDDGVVDGYEFYDRGFDKPDWEEADVSAVDGIGLEYASEFNLDAMYMYLGAAMAFMLFYFVIGAVYRGRIRAKYGIAGSFCGDCWFHFCCHCCSVHQMARQVDTNVYGSQNGAYAMVQQPQSVPEAYVVSVADPPKYGQVVVSSIAAPVVYAQPPNPHAIN